MINREQLKEKYGNEEVLVISENALPKLKEGLTITNEKNASELLKQSYFIPRWASDENPKEIEIIPYVVIADRLSFPNKIFCVTRKDQSNEERLVDKLSLGIGGHINPAKGYQGLSLIKYSLARELNEELYIDSETETYSLFFEGFIRLTNTSVDKDHLGLLYLYLIKDIFATKKYIHVKETNILEGDFVSLKYLKINYNKLENWSKIVVDNFL
jgi:predicted NUDIX family phosphoesterase